MGGERLTIHNASPFMGEFPILAQGTVCKIVIMAGSIPPSLSISISPLSRGEVGEHNGLIHRHFAGSSPAATTNFVC